MVTTKKEHRVCFLLSLDLSGNAAPVASGHENQVPSGKRNVVVNAAPLVAVSSFSS
jgi:hypothetical protein